MDPNVKLLIEEMAKQLRTEIKEGFAVHEASFTKRFDEVAVAEHLRDARLTNLEEAAASSDKALAEWRPEVDASIASIKLELSKLNCFFTREAKASSGSKQGILNNGSAPANTSAASIQVTGIVSLGVFSPKLMTRSRVRFIPLLHLRIFLRVWSFLTVFNHFLLPIQ
jgi:hypothetical protein